MSSPVCASSMYCTVAFAWKCRLFCLCTHVQCHVCYIYHVEFNFRFRCLVSFPVCVWREVRKKNQVIFYGEGRWAKKLGLEGRFLRSSSFLRSFSFLRLSSIKGHLPSKVLAAPFIALKPMATLQTSLEANYDITGRQTKRLIGTQATAPSFSISIQIFSEWLVFNLKIPSNREGQLAHL